MANSQARVVDDAPIYTPFEKSGKISDLWRSWAAQVTAAINRTGPVTNGGARAVTTLALGASPYVYQSPYGGDVRLLIAGGTAVVLQMSRDNITYYSLGVVAGQITLSQGDFIKIGYTIAPSVIAVPA